MSVVSLLLFGEGKTEAVFLNHLKSIYGGSEKLRIKVSRGQGGSPDCVVNRMITTELKIASYDRCLLLLDNDLPIEGKTKKKIEKNEIKLVYSIPSCIEGLLLQILGELPKGGVNSNSQTLKRHFRKQIDAKSDSDALRKLSKNANSLFPKNVLDTAKENCSSLNEIISFLEID